MLTCSEQTNMGIYLTGFNIYLEVVANVVRVI